MKTLWRALLAVAAAVMLVPIVIQLSRSRPKEKKP